MNFVSNFSLDFWIETLSKHEAYIYIYKHFTCNTANKIIVHFFLVYFMKGDNGMELIQNSIPINQKFDIRKGKSTEVSR